MVILQPRDTEGNIIHGTISEVSNIQIFSSTRGAWTTISTAVDAQRFVLQARGETAWRLAVVAGSSNYFTVRNGGSFSANLVAAAGSIICYVQPIDEDSIFELLVGR